MELDIEKRQCDLCRDWKPIDDFFSIAATTLFKNCIECRTKKRSKYGASKKLEMLARKGNLEFIRCKKCSSTKNIVLVEYKSYKIYRCIDCLNEITN